MREITLTHEQAEFFTSNKKFRCFDGGFGNGKSTGGMLALGDHCQRNPGTKAGLFREDLSDLRKSTKEDWLELYGDKGNYKNDTNIFTFYKSGSKVLFHQLSDYYKLRNHNLSAALIEQAEETTEKAFWFLVGRLRRKDADQRWIGVLSNPEGHDWIYKTFYEHDLPDQNPSASEDLDELGISGFTGDDFHLINAETYANQENLTDDYLRGLSVLPDQLYEKYVKGSRDTLAGQVYPMLNSEVHLLEPFQIPKDWPRWVSLDYGSVNPTAILWFAMDFDGNVYVYREHHKAQGDDGKEWLISQHAEHVKSVERDKTDHVAPYRENIRTRYIDPQCKSRILEKKKGNKSVKYSVMEEFADNGLTFQPWKAAKNPEDKMAQINKVGEILKPVEGHNHPITEETPAPNLYIFNTCPVTWEQMTQYQWKEQAKQMIGRKNPPEAPKKLNDHCPDALRGFIVMDPIAEKPEEVAPEGSFDYVRKQIIRQKNSDSGTFDFELA